MLHECWRIKSHRVFLKLYSSIFRSYSTFHNPSFQKLQTPTLSRAAEVRAGLEGVKLYLHCPSFKLLGIEGECVGKVFFFFHLILSICSAEEGNWDSGWVDTWQPAKVNPSHSEILSYNWNLLSKAKSYLLIWATQIRHK